MANRARNILAETCAPRGSKAARVGLETQRVRANSPGAGIFAFLEYGSGARAGFAAYGRKGLPAERVAEAACQALLKHHHSDAPVDMHLADQLILPLALADGRSQFSTCRVTQHTRTNMWVVERFAQAQFETTGNTITVIPRGKEIDA
jgi:RNA 3'-terminal phosphate cyclase (ATP)